MDRDRAAEIIAAYGGDPARWPDPERAAALRLVSADTVLAAQKTIAASLDGVIAAWAADAIGDHATAADAAARVLATPAARRGLRPAWQWAMGGGMAAAAAALVVLVNPAVAPPHAKVGHHAISDDQAFAMVFTPTTDEDGSI